VLVAAALVASCGGEDASESTTATPTAAGAQSESETDTDETTEDEPVDAGPVRVDAEFLALPAGPATLPILGGLEEDLPGDTPVIAGVSCAILDVSGYAGASPFPPYVLVSESSFSGHLQHEPMTTVEQFLALYGDQPAPVPTGETLEVLGLSLDGYRVENAYPTGPPPDENLINCSNDPAVISDLSVLPAVYSDIWIAETDAGLFMIAASAFDAEEQIEARSMLDAIVPTLRRASQ